MKNGADKEVTMPSRDPLTWAVDGVPVVRVHKTRITITETEKTVDAVVLVDRNGHNHYLWNPDDE